MAKEHCISGVMSGTSLDGLDMALCRFQQQDGQWGFCIEKAETAGYSHAWTDRLANAHKLSAEELIKLHVEYGGLTSAMLNDFHRSCKTKPELIAMHGHTIYHRPALGYTYQLGSGPVVAARTGIDTVYDLRAMDLALGGQGAPLVPVGDELLFGTYDYCLNIGGFANVSYNDPQRMRRAHDICPANIVLNHYARKAGKEMDKDGKTGREGQPNESLLGKLNALSYYRQSPPKSLGREWLEAEFLPLAESSGLGIEDCMATLYCHISRQIARELKQGKALVTGGGAHNSYLVELLRQASAAKIIIPEKETVDYKEALIFAFLGLLFHLGRPNCLASVTGARRDCIGGSLAKA